MEAGTSLKSSKYVCGRPLPRRRPVTNTGSQHGASGASPHRRAPKSEWATCSGPHICLGMAAGAEHRAVLLPRRSLLRGGEVGIIRAALSGRPSRRKQVGQTRSYKRGSAVAAITLRMAQLTLSDCHWLWLHWSVRALLISLRWCCASSGGGVCTMGSHSSNIAQTVKGR
ncbi:hypothetical protein NDU88_002539 [Pleurodeles waltl]|uniref:Uncharacterized protein n=1 Tax=Pleurodeles waltl TaxID=8319 RepID=A0AAV7U9K1_PLEWA|nr:hypothetical protein NDU88_002539 [Pleurodeles waltl]